MLLDSEEVNDITPPPIPSTIYIPSHTMLRITCLEESIHTVGLAPSRKTTRNANNYSVQFGSIHIREYERIAGDNPCVRRGVPLGIGWRYQEQKDCSVDAYEYYRKKCKPRRKKPQLVLSEAYRYDLLFDVWEQSPRDLACAVRKARKSRDQRRKTIVVNEFNAHMYHVKESFVEGVVQMFPFSRKKTKADDDPFVQSRSNDHISRSSSKPSAAKQRSKSSRHIPQITMKRRASSRARRPSNSAALSELDVARHRGQVSFILLPDIIGSLQSLEERTSNVDTSVSTGITRTSGGIST
mmetsp:Transcript_8615/g.13445  ORF Transcript_8615/g.13445 Transcript_8615/m.13445 type:complete len:297 (+) Transcript_8615:130-1020(+)